MNLTAYHAKYFAHELTKRCPADSVERLAGALSDAQLDLNPHQIEAALFAFRSALSNAWKAYDEASRDVDRQRDALLDDISRRLGQQIERQTLFTIRWRLETE